MSEKLDGLRAVWTGKLLLSRNGNPFYAPDYFTKDLPVDVTLDGELFLGWGQFQKCVSITRWQDENDEWKDVKYLIFDGPSLKGNFSSRLKQLKTILADTKNKFVKLHEHEVCKDDEHLQWEMDWVTSLGGEGMMIWDPKSPYEYWRSESMLKVKKFIDDEAVVLGKEKGTGRCSNMMGALVCKNKAGV